MASTTIDGIEFLSVKDAAGQLGVSVATARRLCDSGQLEYLRRPGGHRLVRRDSVRAAKQKLLSQPSGGTASADPIRPGQIPALLRIPGQIVGLALGEESMGFACLTRRRTGWFDWIDGQVIRYPKLSSKSPRDAEPNIWASNLRNLLRPSSPLHLVAGQKAEFEIDADQFIEVLDRTLRGAKPDAVAVMQRAKNPSRRTDAIVFASILGKRLPYALVGDQEVDILLGPSGVLSKEQLRGRLKGYGKPWPKTRLAHRAVEAALCALYPEKVPVYMGPSQFVR